VAVYLLRQAELRCDTAHPGSLELLEELEGAGIQVIYLPEYLGYGDENTHTEYQK
jgi:hypothetical protein